MVFPENSIQGITGGEHWWTKETKPCLMRGSIVWTLVPSIQGCTFAWWSNEILRNPVNIARLRSFVRSHTPFVLLM